MQSTFALRADAAAVASEAAIVQIAKRDRRATDELLARLHFHHPDLAPPDSIVASIRLLPDDEVTLFDTDDPPPPSLPQHQDGPPKTQIHLIAWAAAQHLGVPKRLIFSDRRGANLSYARQVAIYITHQLTSASLPKIGRRFGRDHTTILYAVRKITRAIADDPAGKLAGDVKAITELVIKHSPAIAMSVAEDFA